MIALSISAPLVLLLFPIDEMRTGINILPDQIQLVCMAKQRENMPVSNHPDGNAPARDGNIAIREEFDLAVEANTIEALQLFIQRHPDHPLTIEAKQRLEQK